MDLFDDLDSCVMIAIVVAIVLVLVTCAGVMSAGCLLGGLLD